MTTLHAGLVVLATLSSMACGPSLDDRDDVYPRNCGVEGPVELLAGDVPRYADVRRAGERYLVERWPDPATREHWVVDRCGEERVLLHAGPEAGGPRFGTVGEHVLSCDDATGAMAYVDPDGVEPPRPLFPAAEGCRVVPVGEGLAAQERGSGTVWFHPDPSDPDEALQVVTHEAVILEPEWQAECSTLRLDCDGHHPHGIAMRAAGDELLVVLESEALLAFSSTTLEPRVLDAGPVFALDVLANERHLVVERRSRATYVLDRVTGDVVDFCCWSGSFAPIRMFGDWIVQGSFGSPVVPEPAEWEIFQAYHVRTGARTVIEGRDSWEPVAPLTADTALVHVHAYESREEGYLVVWPATGAQQPVDLPGVPLWSVPGRDGIYTVEVGDRAARLHHLAGPGQEPRLVLEDAGTLLVTPSERIVFTRAHEQGEPAPLSVMLPGDRVIALDPSALGIHGPLLGADPWPLAHDEVLYSAANGDGWALRRTVLP